MTPADPLRDLDLLIRSRYGLIVLDTAEEERAETLLRHLADQLQLPLFSWTPTQGLRRLGGEQPGGGDAGRKRSRPEVGRKAAVSRPACSAPSCPGYRIAAVTCL